MSGTISFNRENARSLQAAYDEAVKLGDDEFEWTDPSTGRKHEFITRYAFYVLQHLDEQLAAHPDQPRRPNNEGREP